MGQKQVERFVRETQFLGRLAHLNIVAFYDVGKAGGAIYLVMELVAGPTAEDVLRDIRPMGIRTGVRLTCLMLGGLEHAHAQGFVHRDIKPGIGVIGSQGGKRTVKLADFGLARAYETHD